MKTIKLYAVALLTLLCAVSAQAQTALTQTTLSAAVTSSAINRVSLASTTNIVAGTVLFADKEELVVSTLLGGGAVQVQRGAAGTRASLHVSGQSVLVGPAAAFQVKDPQGLCTAGQREFQYGTAINVVNGLRFVCGINGQVGPGFGNWLTPPNSTTAVASVAGAILPTGPLFHVTGTNAITGITIPVGFDVKSGGVITFIADAVFTWTAAGNFALASSTVSPAGVVVVGRAYSFFYDPNSGKFYQIGG